MTASPDIPDVVRQLVTHWRRLAAGVVLGLLLGLAVPLLQPTTYTATSYLVVVPVGTGTAAEARDFGKVFARVALDPVVVAEAVHLPDLSLTPVEAAEVTTVASSPDAPVLEVTGEGPTAFRSAEVANVVGQGIVLYAEQHADDTGFLLRQFVRAAPPEEPSAPRPLLSVVIGLVLGVALGTLAALVGRGPSRPAEPEVVPHPADPADLVDEADTADDSRHWALRARA